MIEESAPQGALDSAEKPLVALHSSRRRWRRALSVLMLAAGLLWAAVHWMRPVSRPTLPSGVTQTAYARAAQGWKRRYGRTPDDLDVQSWLAESAVAAGDLEIAAACFGRIPSAHPVYGRSARHQEGQILQKLNRPCAAEKNLREFIDLESHAAEPQSELLIDGMQRLRSLLELELRFEERHALLDEMLRRGDDDFFDTLVYLFPSLMRWNGPAVIARADAALAADPKCFEVRRAVGRYRTGQGRLDESRTILDECLKERPSDLPTFAYLLACEYERGGAAAIAETVRQLPAPADGDPWLLLELRGYVCNDQQRFAEAIECFERVLRDDPANSTCHQGIASACLGTHDLERRAEALRITTILTRIQVRIARMIMHGHALQPILEIAESCMQAGLRNHAERMARLGLSLYPHSGEFDALLERLQASNDGAHSVP